MKITRIEITNVRCFQKANIQLSQDINLIVGANNSGKTTLLDCIGWIQGSYGLRQEQRRMDSEFGAVHINLQPSPGIAGLNPRADGVSTQTNWGSTPNQFIGDANLGSWSGFPDTEPNNFIVPYRSKRKVNGFDEGVTLHDLSKVTGDLSNLYAKVDRISNPEFQPAYGEYIEACEEILGFRISSANSTSGKKAAYVVRNENNIPIDMMGEGVSNLLGLIVDLCRVENKLFLIEEPENDIHPKALKKLLDLIVRKSASNQFIITTHSNIVLKHLGSHPTARIFKTTMSFVDRIPTSVVEEVSSHEDRVETLEDMGYELFDIGIWDYWIFLEESSAERLIRDYLIPWFVPKIAGKVRTFSARCLSEIKPKFDDFNRLFVFLNLQQIYKNKVWVIVDSGLEEGSVLAKLQDAYTPSGWRKDNFTQFSKHDFEMYYPERFKEEVSAIHSELDKKVKRAMKASLLESVVMYIEDNEEVAKKEFLESASDVIQLLKTMFGTEN